MVLTWKFVGSPIILRSIFRLGLGCVGSKMGNNICSRQYYLSAIQCSVPRRIISLLYSALFPIISLLYSALFPVSIISLLYSALFPISFISLLYSASVNNE